MKALAIIRLISTPVLFFTHIDLSHWIAWSGSVGLSQASSSSHTCSGGGGRMNSGRKWPAIRGACVTAALGRPTLTYKPHVCACGCARSCLTLRPHGLWPSRQLLSTGFLRQEYRSGLPKPQMPLTAVQLTLSIGTTRSH